MRENARTRLAALRDKKPPTKAAQIRKLWPEINAALDNSHSLKSISECLAADGIAVSFRELSVYVGRLRKESLNTADLQAGSGDAIRDGTASFGIPIGTLAIRESGQPAEVPPVGSAGIAAEAFGQFSGRGCP